MVKTLGPAVIIIPLIAVLENMAIAKAFGNLYLYFLVLKYRTHQLVFKQENQDLEKHIV